MRFAYGIFSSYVCQLDKRRRLWKKFFVDCRGLTGLFMKLAFQIMLCLKLDHSAKRNSDGYDSNYIPFYCLMIPLWILLPVAICDLLYILCSREYKKYHNYQSYAGRNSEQFTPFRWKRNGKKLLIFTWFLYWIWSFSVLFHSVHTKIFHKSFE